MSFTSIVGEGIKPSEASWTIERNHSLSPNGFYEATDSWTLTIPIPSYACRLPDAFLRSGLVLKVDVWGRTRGGYTRPRRWKPELVFGWSRRALHPKGRSCKSLVDAKRKALAIPNLQKEIAEFFRSIYSQAAKAIAVFRKEADGSWQPFATQFYVVQTPNEFPEGEYFYTWWDWREGTPEVSGMGISRYVLGGYSGLASKEMKELAQKLGCWLPHT